MGKAIDWRLDPPRPSGCRTWATRWPRSSSGAIVRLGGVRVLCARASLFGEDMTDDEFRSLFKPTWWRLYALAGASPAAYGLWWLLKNGGGTYIVGAAMCIAWATFCLWGWRHPIND